MSAPPSWSGWPLVVALRNCAADERATPAQCVAALRAVSRGIAPPYSVLDNRRDEKGDTAFADLAAMENVLASLVAVMRAHAGDASVQSAGCDLIFRLVQADCSPDSMAALDVVLTAASAHAADLVTHIHACEALGELIFASEIDLLILRQNMDGTLDARLVGVCDVLCAARRLHANSPAMQTARVNSLGLYVLGKLCGYFGTHSGALLAASTVLHGTPSRQEVEAACSVFTSMSEGCGDDDYHAKYKLWFTTAYEFVEAMLRRRTHPVLQAGATALLDLARNSDATACFFRVGAIEAVVDALRTTTQSSPEEQDEDWSALERLTSFGGEHLQRALDAGVLELPPAAEPTTSAKRANVFKRLHAFQQRFANAVRRADAAMAALLAEEEAERAQSGAPSRKSKAKKRGKAAAARATDAASPTPGGDSAAAEADNITAADDAAAPSAAITQQPSASAARRRRRAAAKAASRQGGALAAAASSSSLSSLDEAADQDAALWTDDSVGGAAISAALQSAHISTPAPPAAAADVAASERAALAAERAVLDAERAALTAEREARACTICLDAPRCMLLLPCKHLALCASPTCLATLGAPPRCPLCRAVVQDSMQLFV